MKAATSLVEKTADMMVMRMMGCLSVDGMAPSSAKKTAEKLEASSAEEKADMMAMLLDCSSEAFYIIQIPVQVYHVLPLE